MVKNETEGHSEIIPLHWPSEPGRSSLRVPTGLKEALDDVIKLLRDRLGVSINRNALIMKAIRHFLNHLGEATTEETLIKRLNLEQQVENTKLREELRDQLLPFKE